MRVFTLTRRCLPPRHERARCQAVQIEDRGPILDRVTEQVVRRCTCPVLVIRPESKA